MSIKLHVYLTFISVVLLTYSANAASIVTLPDPLELEWDISKENSTLEQIFLVKKYFAYDIFLRFVNFSRTKDQFSDVEKFTGYGSRSPYDLVHHKWVTWEAYRQMNPLVQKGAYQVRYDRPGTIIPIHIKIEKIDDQKNSTPLVDQTFNTEGSDNGYKGGLHRKITFIRLKPGNYKLTASTMQKTVLPPDIFKVFLDVIPPPDSYPLPENE